MRGTGENWRMRSIGRRGNDIRIMYDMQEEAWGSITLALRLTNSSQWCHTAGQAWHIKGVSAYITLKGGDAVSIQLHPSIVGYVAID